MKIALSYYLIYVSLFIFLSLKTMNLAFSSIVKLFCKILSHPKHRKSKNDKPDCKVPRPCQNFVTKVFLTCCFCCSCLKKILTGEDWNSVMYSGVKALGGPHSAAGVAASLYFVLLVILGNCILQSIHSAEQSISREVQSLRHILGCFLRETRCPVVSVLHRPLHVRARIVVLSHSYSASSHSGPPIQWISVRKKKCYPPDTDTGVRSTKRSELLQGNVTKDRGDLR